MSLAGVARLLCVLCGLAVVLAVPARASERILDYVIDVAVQADASLEVTEHITVRAEGQQIRRGIYRDFPTRYRNRQGNNVVVDLEVLGLERDGQPEPWFTERRPNGIRINFGDDTFLQVPAEYHYTLRYRTTRQPGFFDEHDELYWNAIGTGWDFPIDAARVQVRLPELVPVARMSAEAYTGPQGAQGQDWAASLDAPGVADWRLTAPLAPREGFTIVLMFPKGILPQPTRAQRIGWLLKDNRGILVALAGLVVLLVYCVRRWHQVGRDPRPGVVFARYEPPPGRSPAELRYLQRRRYDNRCFTADLLTAAVAGHVLIHCDKRTLRRDAWRLERTGASEGVSPVTAAATALFGGLFNGGRKTLDLEKANADTLQKARQAHAAMLDQRLNGSHFQRNGGSIGVAVLIAAVTGVLAFLVSGGGGLPVIMAICVLMAGVLIAFGVLVQAPTEQGRALLDETAGLKLYLSVAERDELKHLPGPDQPPPLDAGRYQRLLPYAVALDVEEAWTNKFTLAVGAAAAAAVTGSIAWYRGGGASDLGSLSRSVGSSLNASIASASTPPGSASGGGGGGSSGGGGGGGGGGGR